MPAVDEQQAPARKNPKKGVVFGVFFLALFAAIFGIFQIRKNLHPNLPWANPFQSSASQNESPAFSSAINDALALQAKDTDGDGLSDYDELNRYKTSPYLKDTDSDGIDDKTEATQGTDPNCPKGQDCAPQPNPPTSGIGTGQAALGITVPSTSSGNNGSTGQVPPFTPENARALLRQGGLTEEQIVQFDDATLRQMYEESVAKAQTNNTSPNPLLRGEGTSSQYTPAQIRELLKASGVSEQLLQSVDDATIMQIFNEAIKGQQ